MCAFWDFNLMWVWSKKKKTWTLRLFAHWSNAEDIVGWPPSQARGWRKLVLLWLWSPLRPGGLHHLLLQSHHQLCFASADLWSWGEFCAYLRHQTLNHHWSPWVLSFETTWHVLLCYSVHYREAQRMRRHCRCWRSLDVGYPCVASFSRSSSSLQLGVYVCGKVFAIYNVLNSF